ESTEHVEHLIFKESWQLCEMEARSLDPPAGTVLILHLDERTKEDFEAAARELWSPTSLAFLSGSTTTLQDSLRKTLEEHAHITAVWCLWYLEGRERIDGPMQVVQLLKALADAGLRDAKILIAASYSDSRDRCHLESWIGFEKSVHHVLPQTQL